MKLLKTNPIKMQKIWGGNRLGPMIGETWDISTHPEGRSISDPLINLDYLVKLIDTSDNLSVQVHPGDEYARQHENSSGKTECWLILDSVPGAGIYLGFKKGVTKREFQTAVSNNLDASTFLNFYAVKPGDFFFVPAGAVHAIGKGVFLAEIQQSSGITYRVWDWNRVGNDGRPRALHVDKAMDVLNFTDHFNADLKANVLTGLLDKNQDVELKPNPFFKANLLHVNGSRDIVIPKHSSLMLLSDDLCINGQSRPKFSSYIAVEPCQITLGGKGAAVFCGR